MGSLANISSEAAIKVFAKHGWRRSRQTGSHIVLIKDGELVNLSIPQRKELAKGTLRVLIRNAGLSVDDFIALL